jgi:hypothetical protein
VTTRGKLGGPLGLALLALGAGAGCVVDDTYGTCVVDADCNDLDDTCEALTLVDADTGEVITSGGSCTHACIDDRDCEDQLGFAGVCYALGGRDTDPRLCYQRCGDDRDCDFDQVCTPLVDTTDALVDLVCTPDNF